MKEDFNTVVPLECGYQKEPPLYHRKSSPSPAPNSELRTLNTRESVSKGWLDSLHTLSGALMSSGLASGEHQLMPGINSEFEDKGHSKKKYSS